MANPVFSYFEAVSKGKYKNVIVTAFFLIGIFLYTRLYTMTDLSDYVPIAGNLAFSVFFGWILSRKDPKKYDFTVLVADFFVWIALLAYLGLV